MGKIKFGWVATNQAVDDSPSSDLVSQITTGLEQIQAGFDSVWVADHFHPAVGKVNDRDVLECMTTISYLAGAFPHIDFGSIVLCQSYRNPALLAKMAATLQLLTGGRFILGLGAGWKEDEYLAYGYDFPKVPVRIAQLEEAVQIIHKMWTDSPANFEGKYYHIRDAYCEPRPNPSPPIMIGGGGEQLTLRVVAKVADWWNGGGNAETCAHKLSVLRAHCERVGRNYQEIVTTWWLPVAIAKTEAEAKRIAETSPFFFVIVGTPAQVVEQLQPFIELGVEYFLLYFLDFPSTTGSILLFAEEVIPQLDPGR